MRQRVPIEGNPHTLVLPILHGAGGNCRDMAIDITHVPFAAMSSRRGRRRKFVFVERWHLRVTPNSRRGPIELRVAKRYHGCGRNNFALASRPKGRLVYATVRTDEWPVESSA